MGKKNPNNFQFPFSVKTPKNKFSKKKQEVVQTNLISTHETKTLNTDREEKALSPNAFKTQQLKEPSFPAHASHTAEHRINPRPALSQVPRHLHRCGAMELMAGERDTGRGTELSRGTLKPEVQHFASLGMSRAFSRDYYCMIINTIIISANFGQLLFPALTSI